MRLIDKEAMLEKLFALADANREWKPEYTQFCEDMIVLVEDSPFWEEEDLVPHGRWIMHDDEWGLSCECSVCHIETCGDSPYCPNCGAKMDGGKENERT